MSTTETPVPEHASDTAADTAETIEPQDVEDEAGERSPFLAPFVVSSMFGALAAVMIAGWMYGASDHSPHRHRGASAAVVSSRGLPSKGDPQHGKELFGMTCIACHGPTGSGIPHLGANLRESRFIAARSDDELVAFIKKGRQPGEPNSVLGLMMPPKGGNPALDDNGIHDIVAFIRTLNEGNRLVAGAQ